MQAHVPQLVMRRNNKAKKISPHLLPLPQDAVQQYRLNGGRITDPDQNSTDPLLNSVSKINIRFQSLILLKNILHLILFFIMWLMVIKLFLLLL